MRNVSKTKPKKLVKYCYGNLSNVIKRARMLKRAENWRDHEYMSQSYLATKLGYKSAQTISDIERGNTNIPVARIKDFAQALDIPEEDIIEAMVHDYRGNIEKEVIETKNKNTLQ